MTGFELMFYGTLLAAAAGPPQSGPLTIDQAAAIAERQAFTVRLQQSGLLRANSVVRQAESRLGPSITGNVNVARAGQALYGNFGSTDPSTPASPVLLSPINTSTVGLTATIPIDLSGALHANLRSAEASRRSQRETVRASLNDARLDGRTAFINVLRAQATVGVQEQSLANARAQALQAQQQFEQVQVAKIDVDRLNAQVAQRESDLINAQNQLQISVYQLNLALARPIETPIEPLDVTSLPEAPRDPGALDRIARETRPETRAARELVEAQAQLRAGAERANIPNLNLSVSQTRNFGDLGFSGQNNQTSLGLTFSIPIFDSGYIRSQVGIYRQDEAQARIRLAQQELTVSQEVRTASTNLVNARARLENAQRQVALAQEVFRIAQVRQQAGAGTYVEVVDAETQLTTARNNLVNARYDVLTAYSQLQRAVGTDALPTSPASSAAPTAPTPTTPTAGDRP